MSQSMVVCRVQGLTSSKGQTLNGLAGSFDPSKPPQAGRRGVLLDGVQGPPLAIKPQNLHILTTQNKPFENLAVAVGREDLLSEECMATVVDQRRGKRVTAQMISASEGGPMRSLGTLKALLEYFQTKKVPKNGDIVIHVTDLNLALLFNSHAFAATEKELDASQQELANKIRKHILRHRNHHRVILFKYQPFRIDRRDRSPKEMVAAALSGRFHIYPCPCDSYLDALEVRYLAPGRSTHCFFLDYGQGETIQYVRNISCMEEDLERLQPEVLADVDPQMFWSCVLQSKRVLKELKKLRNCPEDLIKQWTNIYSAYLKSVMSFREHCISPAEAVRLLPDSKGKWNLINEDIHYKVAIRNAKLALLTVMQDVWEKGQMKHCAIELMDNYKGSDIDVVVSDFTKACASNDDQDIEIALGTILSWKETKTCDHCGIKQKQMFDCTNCYSALYCGEECQLEAWPTHKKVCKDLAKSREENPPQVKPFMNAGMYKPHKVEKRQNRGTIQMFSEACGVGFLRIMWYPARTDIKNTVTFKALKNDTIFKTETIALQGRISGPSDIRTLLMDCDQVAVFDNELSNLDPITRLCLACGPMPMLDLAQQTLNDALVQARGLPQNLRMPWVGFTPLEWASKKGHMEIVQWLVSEPRTQPLLKVGTPVGWACYTGRVEIARFLVHQGASPEATNEAFWDSRPPLLAAAENGMLESVKFLVEECGVSLSTKWKGNGIKEHVEMAPSWYEIKGHNAVLDYISMR